MNDTLKIKTRIYQTTRLSFKQAFKRLSGKQTHKRDRATK